MFAVARHVRGRKLAAPAFEAVLRYLLATCAEEHIVWHTHRDNLAVLKVARRFATDPAVSGEYLVFAYP